MGLLIIHLYENLNMYLFCKISVHLSPPEYVYRRYRLCSGHPRIHRYIHMFIFPCTYVYTYTHQYTYIIYVRKEIFVSIHTLMFHLDIDA